MKKVFTGIGRILLWLVGGAGLLLGLRAAIIVLLIVAMFPAMLLLGTANDEVLLTSVSPTRAYELEVHRINPGVWEPCSIRVLRTDDGRDRQIYQMHGQEEADVKWLTDESVSINGIALDLAAGETYSGDLAHLESMELCIAIGAEDVYALEMEYGIARKAIGRCGMSNARESLPLSPGETHGFHFLLGEDFPRQDSLKQGPFWMVLTVYTGDNKAIQLPFLYEWNTGWRRSHSFTLSGSRAAGFTLTPEFTGCTVLPLGEAFP